jgi:hypothetical protein
MCFQPFDDVHDLPDRSLLVSISGRVASSYQAKGL